MVTWLLQSVAETSTQWVAGVLCYLQDLPDWQKGGGCSPSLFQLVTDAAFTFLQTVCPTSTFQKYPILQVCCGNISKSTRVLLPLPWLHNGSYESVYILLAMSVKTINPDSMCCRRASKSIRLAGTWSICASGGSTVKARLNPRLALRSAALQSL